MRFHFLSIFLVLFSSFALGCGDDDSVDGGVDASLPDAIVEDAEVVDGEVQDARVRDVEIPDAVVRPDAIEQPPVTGEWPTANEWSWNGRWTPSFPLSGLRDSEYNELPPGEWDYRDENDDKANWRNFMTNVGTWNVRVDSNGNEYGWDLVGNVPDAVDYTGGALYFEGSPGADWIDTGAGGYIHSWDAGTTAGGPDVLIFNRANTLDFRTGSSLDEYENDDDLVIAGCDGSDPGGNTDINTMTIHTGPGNDWAFMRDWERSAIDLGNGEGGLTHVLDPLDGNDLAVVRGTAWDFRVYGGEGDDVFVWYADEVVQEGPAPMWLGPNFFGGGGQGDALWDQGTDRFVLAVPSDTTLVTATPTPPGSLFVRAGSGELIQDAPTADDLRTYYCVECGVGPGGRKTAILEYHKADGSVFTGFFYLTGIEEVQVGVGDGATVYALDDVNGTLTPMPNAEPFDPPTPPASFCQ